MPAKKKPVELKLKNCGYKLPPWQIQYMSEHNLNGPRTTRELFNREHGEGMAKWIKSGGYSPDPEINKKILEELEK